MDAPVSRRDVLRGSGAATVVALLWATRATGSAEASQLPGDQPLCDAALLMESLALNPVGANNTDLRGTTFWFEGWLYPFGTVPAGDGFDPSSKTPIGHWYCHGVIIGPDDRAMTTQEYTFALASPERTSPRPMLITHGFESAQLGRIGRAVIGGTARYRQQRGEVVQEVIGTTTDNGPTYRYWLRD